MISTRNIPRFGSSTLYGVLLTLAAVFIVELSSRVALRVPLITGLVAVVAYVAFVAGSRAGLLSAGVTTAYSVYFFSSPGQLFNYSGENGLRFVLLSLTAVTVAVLVGALRQAVYAMQEQLQDQVELSRAIDDSLAEGVYVLDREGRVTYMNPMAETLLGWSQAEVAGNYMHDVIHYQRPDGTPFPREECTGLMEVVQSQRRFRTDDDVFIRKDGRHLPVAYSTAPIMVSGKVTGVVVAFRDITEQKQAVATLQRREEYFRALVQNSTELITVTRADGSVAYQSPSIEHVLGYKASDIVGNVFADIVPIHPDDYERVAHKLAVVLNQPHTMVSDELRVQHANGEWRIFEMTARNLLDEPHVQGIVSNFRNITVRKQTEDSLRASEAKLRLMYEQIPAHVWVTNTELRVISTSGSALPAIGIDARRYIEQPLDDLVRNNELRETMMDAHQRVLQGEAATYELTTAGHAFACRVEPLRDRDGQIVGCLGVAVDVTERQRSEQRLSTQYAVSRALVETSTLNEAAPIILREVGECLGWDYGGLWLIDPSEQVLRCIATWEARGNDLSSFIAASRRMTFAIGQGLPGHIWREVAPQWLSNIADLSEFPRLSLASAQGVRAGFGIPIELDGAIIGVFEFLSRQEQTPDEAVLDMARAIGYQVGQFVKRERAERELKIRAAQQAVIAELGRRALATLNLATTFSDTASIVAETLQVRYCEILELSPKGDTLLLTAGSGWQDGVVGSEILEAGVHSQAGFTLQAGRPIIVSDVRTETRFHTTRLFTQHGVVSSITVVIYGRSGPWGVLGAAANERRLFSADDVHFLQAVANVLGTAIERKSFEQQLAQERAETQRLTELEQLRRQFVQSVSHQLRTPLTAMRGGLGMLEASAEERLPRAELQLLKNARRNVERLRSMIDDLLLLNQIEQGTLQLNIRPVDLRTVVANILPIMQPLFEEKGQTLQLNISEALVAWIDERQMEQACSNLLMNAYQHTPAGTCIVISGQQSDNDVQLTVTDDGPGIPAEELRDLFQRSSDLGSVEGGPRLGLQIARAIVEIHHGKIIIENGAEGGLTITISLPAPGTS